MVLWWYRLYGFNWTYWFLKKLNGGIKMTKESAKLTTEELFLLVQFARKIQAPGVKEIIDLFGDVSERDFVRDVVKVLEDKLLA